MTRVPSAACEPV